MPGVAAITLPPVVVLRSDPDGIEEMVRLVVEASDDVSIVVEANGNCEAFVVEVATKYSPTTWPATDSFA